MSPLKIFICYFCNIYDLVYKQAHNRQIKAIVAHMYVGYGLNIFYIARYGTLKQLFSSVILNIRQKAILQYFLLLRCGQQKCWLYLHSPKCFDAAEMRYCLSHFHRCILKYLRYFDKGRCGYMAMYVCLLKKQFCLVQKNFVTSHPLILKQK